MSTLWLSYHKSIHGTKNEKIKVMYNSIKHVKNLLCDVDFARMFQVIKYFTQLNPLFGKEDITFPLSSSPIAVEWQNILMNLNQVCLLLIQKCTMSSQLIKNNSVGTLFIQ